MLRVRRRDFVPLLGGWQWRGRSRRRRRGPCGSPKSGTLSPASQLTARTSSRHSDNGFASWAMSKKSLH
jgi:hypothetical protein